MHYIRYIALFSLLCDCCYAHYYEDTLKTFLKAKEPINISNIVVDLVTNTPCIIDNWDNVKKYACRCALVKGAEYTTPDNRDGTLVIQRATEQGFCTDELLAQLRKDENLEDSADTDFINDLYYRSKVIKEIQISPDSDLYKTDKLTEQELKNMLAQAYNEKKIIHPAFAAKKCINVKNISAQGGLQTPALFIINNLCSVPDEFIVKELPKAKHEIFDLSLAFYAEELQPYIYPHHEPDFPVFVLPIAYFHYQTQEKSHYLSIMPKAPGTELLKLMNDYVKSPDPYKKATLIKAYSAIGTTLAKFHKKFMRNIIGKDSKGRNLTIPTPDSLSGLTLTHGDFHSRNVFYDPATDTVYWIDTERAGKAALVPNHIDDDIAVLIYQSFALAGFSGNKEEWAQTFFKSFLQSYLIAFGGDTLKHAQTIKTIATQHAIQSWWGKNSAQVKQLTSYINEVMQQIIDDLQESEKDVQKST